VEGTENCVYLTAMGLQKLETEKATCAAGACTRKQLSQLEARTLEDTSAVPREMLEKPDTRKLMHCQVDSDKDLSATGARQENFRTRMEVLLYRLSITIFRQSLRFYHLTK
jgi:hypothetical protein